MFMTNQDISDLESFKTMRFKTPLPDAFNVDNDFAVIPNISDTLLRYIAWWHSTTDLDGSTNAADHLNRGVNPTVAVQSKV